jgi:hypothetical protein
MSTRVVRVALLIAGLALYFWTGSLTDAVLSSEIEDRAHALLAPLNALVLANPAWADALITASNLVIDAMGIFLVVRCVTAPSAAPLLGLFMMFGLSQLCQALVVVPQPPGKIWYDPGLIPSLLESYEISGDLFFSGHIVLAVYGAIELGRLGSRWLLALGVALALFEVVTVLVLQGHWFADVFTAVVVAVCAALLAPRLAPALDAMIARSVGRPG